MAAAIRIVFCTNSRFNFQNYKILRHQKVISAIWKNAFPFKIHFSTVASHKTTENESIKFDALMKLRKNEAARTIAIEVKSKKVAESLYAKHFENIKKAYLYKSSSDNQLFLLMEFKSENQLTSYMSNVNYTNSEESIPVFSHFVKFDGSAKSKSTSMPELIDHSQFQKTAYLKSLHESKDVSEQMQNFYNETKLCDIQSRFRFLICKQLESTFRGLFPFSEVKPFGSSVNGFGNFDSDADMVLLMNAESTVHNQKKKNEERLTFQEKSSYRFERQQVKKTLEIYGDVLDNFLPGCFNVQKILNARVPIIKFFHSFTGLECDLAASNGSALLMSELLYLMGEFDNRVRPLVFTVFKWARTVGVTNSTAGLWLTNFQLTLLVIFYLQRLKNPILPSLNELRTGQQNNTFIQDVNDFPQLENDVDLENLMKGFFYFYGNFDFKNTGISINRGSNIVKPDSSSIYIENPLDPELNVCRNVSYSERQKFVQLVSDALFTLDRSSASSAKVNWGIISLFQPDAVGKNTFEIRSLFPTAKDSNVVVGGEYEAGDRKSEKQTKNVLHDSIKKLSDKNELVAQPRKRNKKNHRHLW